MKGIAPWLQAHWDWRAAGNFICGGTGSGLLVLAAAHASSGGTVDRIVVLAGLALIAAGLAMVWTELGRQLRFLNVFRHARTSWMTREAQVAMPLFAIGALAAWTGERAWLLCTAALALGFLYSQARMLQASKGIPAWRIATSVPLMVATGLAEGAGALLVLQYLASGGKSVVGPAQLWLYVVLLALRFINWEAYRQSIKTKVPEDAEKAIAHVHPHVLRFGHAAPAAALLAGLLLPGIAAEAGALAGLLVIEAGWRLKFCIVRKAAFNQGFALPFTPNRGLTGAHQGIKPGWRS
jgi:phenylacetyl-CoA:acceptor oxidoreductase 26-kDa subunit